MRSWALITGGSVRLGREIGLAFARAGWHVACHYNHSETEAHALCAELRALGVDALAVQGDLEDEASCQSMFDTTVAITGTALHCVVNNASLFVPDEGADFDEAQALAQIKVNLMAPMRLGKWMAALHAHADVAKEAANTGNANASATQRIKPSVIHVLDQKVFNLNPRLFFVHAVQARARALSQLTSPIARAHLACERRGPGLDVSEWSAKSNQL